MLKILLISLLFYLLSISQSTFQDLPQKPLPDGRWSITLSNAATPKKSDVKTKVDVEILLERSAGKWNPLFSSITRVFGLIEEVEENGILHVRVFFDAEGRSGDIFKEDNYVVSNDVNALISYRLVLSVNGDRTISGTWDSPQSGKGVLNGQILPMPMATKYIPKLGVHPRFLLCPDQIASIKAKAETPWGRDIVAHLDKETYSRSNRAVGLGLKYLLTGDKNYAIRAQSLILQDIDGGWWDAIGPIHDPAYKVIEAFFAWDLIYDACDISFNERILSKARNHLRYLDNYCNVERGNPHPLSNWSAQFRSAIGVAALAIISDSSKFVEPEPIAEIKTIIPPKVMPSQSLPVLNIPVDNNQITKWLVAGPFDIGLGNDGLALIGGSANAAIFEGMKFPLFEKAQESKEINDLPDFHLLQLKNSPFSSSDLKGDDGQSLTKKSEGIFRRVPTEWICAPNTLYGKSGYLDLRKASGYRSYRCFYLAAAIKITSPVTLRVRLQDQQRHDPCIYLAGQKLLNNEIVHLQSGLYPVIIPVTLTSFVSAHGRNDAVFHDFYLDVIDSVQEKQTLTHLKAKHDFHNYCRKSLEGSPFSDYWPHLWLAYSRCMADAWASDAISERGWNIAGDCYTIPSLYALAPFAHAYANSTGITMASTGNLGWVLPQKVAGTIFSEDGALSPSYGRGGGPFGPMPYARCFSLTEKRLQPAVGWAAYRTLSLAQNRKLIAPELIDDELDPMSAAFALLQWPAPEKVKNPEGIIPHSIYDSQRNAWTFRNRFQDSDDAIAMISGFIHPGGDWKDAVSGEFRLAALGGNWALRGICSGDERDPANVVQLANEILKQGEKIVYRTDNEQNTNESNIVNLKLHKLDGNVIGPAIGYRSFLSDFSGVCGAPVLVVVNDILPTISKSINMDNGKNTDNFSPPINQKDFHRWQLVTDSENRINLKTDGFLLTAPNGATLNATILSPSAFQIWEESKKIRTELNYYRDHRGGSLPRSVIQVGGKSPFLIVMTIQHGEAPKVILNGNEISVGKRKISIEDKKMAIKE